MVMKIFRWIVFLVLLTGRAPVMVAQSAITPAFRMIVIGSGGGVEGDNLNGYLLGGLNAKNYIMLDAGTLVSGIQKAVDRGAFYDVFVPPESKYGKTGYILRHLIKGYLISHAHLDHIAGLVIGSPADTNKVIYAGSTTIGYLRSDIFNWEIWPNFTNEGEGLHLDKYRYRELTPGTPVPVAGTRFEVTAFTISHQEPYGSSAFLLSRYGEYVLYVGDTGADDVEGTGRLQAIWDSVAPIIRQGRMHAIFIECAYATGRPESQLFGHLDPQHLTRELKALAITVDSTRQQPLEGLKVIITGIKPTLGKDTDARFAVYRQLLEMKNTGVEYILPEQGRRIEF